MPSSRHSTTLPVPSFAFCTLKLQYLCAAVMCAVKLLCAAVMCAAFMCAAVIFEGFDSQKRACMLEGGGGEGACTRRRRSRRCG